MSSILMTTVFYKAVILQGEIWSLLGRKGLREVIFSRREVATGFDRKHRWCFVQVVAHGGSTEAVL